MKISLTDCVWLGAMVVTNPYCVATCVLCSSEHFKFDGSAKIALFYDGQGKQVCYN